MITIYKSCSKCGKIHKVGYKCKAGVQIRTDINNEERKLRNTHSWHKKSEQIRNQSNYLCEVCKEEGRYNYNNVEVHHIEKVKNRPERLLDDNNLITLCKEHHRQADEGKIDKDYLIKLVKKRYDKLKS